MMALHSSGHRAGLPASALVVKFISNPGYLLLSIVVTIFVLEAMLMLVLEYLPSVTYYQEAILDASLLSLTVIPALYLFVFRPLRIHIDLRRQAEAEKDALIIELQDALDEVKTLQGLIPICASCKKIRDDQGFWQQLEVYITDHSDAVFSHGICPECTKTLYPEFVQSK